MNDIDVQHIKKGEVNIGTSIMAVAYEGGVVLGADGRTTMGPYIANRVTDKLTHISDRIYCCHSGSAADTQAVADVIAYYLSVYSVEHGQPPVRTAASLFQEIVYQNKDALSAGIIVAGWDPKDGGSVHNVPLAGGLFQQPWAIGGSGSSYIYGYCDVNWKPGLSKEETLEFVKNGQSFALPCFYLLETLTSFPLVGNDSSDACCEPRQLFRWHNPNDRHIRKKFGTALYPRCMSVVAQATMGHEAY